jgi:nucleoside-diphosphate-sugar epimerase
MGLVFQSSFRLDRVVVNASNPDLPRRVFVTGATGFIGRHLCGALVEREWQVVASTRAGSHGLSLPGVRVVSMDLSSNPSDWQAAMHSCQAVVHLAARVHQFAREAEIQSEYDRVNVDGTRFVAEQALRANVRRFVYLSSIKVNGEGCDRPYRSSDVPDPKDPYGRSKWAAEQSLRALCARSAMELAVIRPPLVYGPGVKANFRRLMRFAHSGMPLPLASIANRRSLIGVTNLVDFIEACLLHPAASADTWLVSDGEDLSTPDLLGRLSRLMGRPSRMFRFPPAWLRGVARPLGLAGAVDRLSGTLQVDSSAARNRLAWSPPATVEEELARTVAAYLAERTA